MQALPDPAETRLALRASLKQEADDLLWHPLKRRKVSNPQRVLTLAEKLALDEIERKKDKLPF